jgi:hypothetical protein
MNRTGPKPNSGQDHHVVKASAVAAGGSFGMASPKIDTSIRVGRGQVTNRPTLAQVLAETRNVIDLARSGSPAPGLLERVHGLQRWVQQDREWRRTGFDPTSLEQLDLKLRELKDRIEKGIADRYTDLRSTVDDLEMIHGVLTREQVDEHSDESDGTQSRVARSTCRPQTLGEAHDWLMTRAGFRSCLDIGGAPWASSKKLKTRLGPPARSTRGSSWYRVGDLLSAVRAAAPESWSEKANPEGRAIDADVRKLLRRPNWKPGEED